jgi:hypothetical protein
MSPEASAPQGEFVDRFSLVRSYLEAARSGHLDEVRSLTPQLHEAYRGIPDTFIYEDDFIEDLLDRGTRGGIRSVIPGLMAVTRLRRLHEIPLNLVTGYEPNSTDVDPGEAFLVSTEVIDSLNECGGDGDKHVRGHLGFIYGQLKREKQYAKAAQTNELYA